MTETPDHSARPGRPPLSAVLPPLVLGTATFNTQYVAEPEHMPYAAIVARALAEGVIAFDTSPYYGPAETLLGDALSRVRPPPPRQSYVLITKAGRIASEEFDYSPRWVRYSVLRSLARLRTPYLDLVYMHDVEFVTETEVLAAVAELRRMRDEGLLRYVGISGYPVERLCALAEAVRRQSDEPLDAVLSFCHFCVQNTTLGRDDVLARLRAAGVGVVLNASMLSMGLLTTRGADRGPMATWHPAPDELRVACRSLAGVAAAQSETLEGVAIRWALEGWAKTGAVFGSTLTSRADVERAGVSVMGISSVAELEESCRVWRDVLEELVRGTSSRGSRSSKIQSIVEGMRAALGKWQDYSWASPGVGYVNQRSSHGTLPDDEITQKDAQMLELH